MMERFTAPRRARWGRLQQLLQQARRPGIRLGVPQLEELSLLYRQTANDLATAQREFPGDPITAYLAGLVGQAHGHIYVEPPVSLARLRWFFAHDLPWEYRAAWPFLATAAALLFGPWLAVMAAVLADRQLAELVVPPSLLAGIQQGETWFDIDESRRTATAAFIMTNNVQVAVLAFAGGMFAGVGTVLLLAYNGLSLGGVSGALVAYGLGDRLAGFVGPHGFLELVAIVVCGGCGLMLGHAMLWPGFLPRGDALRHVARRAAYLLLGTLPFFVVAGLIEGYVSPLDVAWPLKVAFGAVVFAVYLAYVSGLLGGVRLRR